jgi:3-deoxy-7-phosphoheptulonate synthase
MVVVMEPKVAEGLIQNVMEHLKDLGFDIHRSDGVTHTILGAVGDKRGIDIRQLEILEGVHEVIRISEPYKLASRSFKKQNTVIKLDGLEIGSSEVIVAAGPCSVESREQVNTIAKAVKQSGAKLLRGGAFKPRTSPYSFQGLGEDGLKYLRDAADKYELYVITEVIDVSHISLICKYADILQVGARNMQNFMLLGELGMVRKPVLLKRGMSATIEEWLMASEYILKGGNENVILCERGIRTFENYTRNTLDISAVPVIKKLSHLPIFTDPSHGTGIREKVIPMARASIAAGADGIIVEVHHDPDHAKSDGAQSLYPYQFDQMMGAPQRRRENMREKIDITVIGIGLIGGSICEALKRKDIRVKGVSSKKTIEKAEAMKIIDNGYQYSQIGEAVRESEFIFICTPLMDIGEKLGTVFKCAARGSIITDVGSTKSVICRIAEKHIQKGQFFIGGHPMAGSEKRGVENANPYLFYDAVYVLTPLSKTPKKVVKKLSSLITMLGAKIMILDPDLHDRIAANISHLPQLLAVLLTNHLGDKNDDLFRNLAAGGFRDMTRIASSSFEVWQDIIKTNIEQISIAMGDFEKRLSSLSKNIADEGYLKDAFERAQAERKTIPRYSKGFLKSLFDVRVSVKDRPGELAKITNSIYYRGINIKDIEIVNVREGEGGILRLGFSEKSEAQKAALALQDIGYETSVVE